MNRREYCCAGPSYGFGPPLVESGDAETAASNLLVTQDPDQIAGDNKEDIQANEAARNKRFRALIGDDRCYCDRAQTLDVRTILDRSM